MDSEPKTNMELDSPDEQSPRLVLIVSDGSLMAGRPEQLAGRSTIHMPIASPELPLPAIVTTVATGVDATTHGIVTAATIEPTTLETRLVQASERWFPTFWNSGNAVGIRTALIDWPASIGDPDVSFLTPPPEIDNRMAQGTSVEDAALALLREEFDPMEPLMLHRLQRAHASLLEPRDLLASDSPPPCNWNRIAGSLTRRSAFRCHPAPSAGNRIVSVSTFRRHQCFTRTQEGN